LSTRVTVKKVVLTEEAALEEVERRNALVADTGGVRYLARNRAAPPELQQSGCCTQETRLSPDSADLRDSLT
jgi:hypothetical protein